MKNAPPCPAPCQRGLSLIELMVALAIGLITTLVIMQVFTVFEDQKRATTGSADAQTSDSIALYLIARDLQMAGYGLLTTTDFNPYTCNPAPLWDDDANPATPRVTFDLSPALIIDGGDAPGASDSLTVAYGNTTMGGIPNAISALVGNAATLGSAPGNNYGCRVGDLALVISGTACTISRITGPTDIATPPVASVPPNTSSVTLNDLTGVGIGSYLACLGSWTRVTYSVANGNLLANGTPVVAGILALKAQYGIAATPNSNTVAAWVDAGTAPWNAPTSAERDRIKAVRLAVVARNAHYERDTVSSACSSTTAASPTGLCAWAGSAASPAPAIDLSNDPDWQHYRYRVLETIVPLRNVIWARPLLP